MKNHKVILYLAFVVLSILPTLSFSQPPTDSLPGDPGAISVYTIQEMSFGAFTQGASGGTVVISNTGVRSATGAVVLLNLGVAYHQSVFEIDASEGSIISIMYGPNTTLTSSNGGTMTLSLGPSSPASPFATIVQHPMRTEVSIGGTLTVGNATASPPGTYTGTFYVTVNQE